MEVIGILKKKFYMELSMRKINGVCGVFFLLSLFFSCRSAKQLPVQQRELENITENRLMKNVADNELKFETINSKKIDMSVVINKKSRNLKASLRIERDSFIWINLSVPAMNIGRILLTPDSVRYLDYYNKEYLVGDYSIFTEKMGIYLDYAILQKLLCNHFFDFDIYGETDIRNTRYKFDKTGTHYLLYTLEERAIDRKLKRLYKKKRKNKEFSLIMRKIEIEPDHFRPCSVMMKDMDEDVGIEVIYQGLKDFEGMLFPEKLILSVFSPVDNIKVNINFERIEFNVPVSPTFKIPDKYKKIEN